MAIKINADTVIFDDRVFCLGSGPTGSRPVSPLRGMIWYNTTLGYFEGYNGTAWAALGGSITLNDLSDVVADTPATGQVLSYNGTNWISTDPAGFTGSVGFRGSVGFTGSQGNNAGLRYDFSTSTVDADPGTGTFRFNNASILSVTQIYIDGSDTLSNDFSSYIDSWDDSTNPIKGFISVDSNLSSDISHSIFRLTSITTAAGYRKLNVVFVSGTAPSNAEACVISFTRAGDVGFTGSVANLFVGTTAPASPATGAVWVDTN